MAGTMVRMMPMSHRIFKWESQEIDFSGDPAAINISDTVFGFLEEESEGSLASNNSDNGYGEIINEEAEEEEEEKENSENSEEDKNFWEKQNQLLHGTLCRTSSIESTIRNVTKEAVKEAGRSFCVCGGRAVENGCRTCLMKEVCRRLQNAGFNSAICKSKWKSSTDIPSGEHTFIDVIDNSNSKKREVRVIIELSFRGEFEMARASEEYNQLIKRLPEIFVGKIERLLSLIKILCSAAKKCMKEKKIHIGPWRKQRYMQAKWLRTCERTVNSTPLSGTGYSTRQTRPRASMLTVDLLENLPGFNRTAVEVV
ncbi:hypothetical protein M9H77_25885 [Catharanthus roseus]|uniref:Uncharacterized protein n=1 Tax=Catharanthus roseus TaxID=4058 RepID=A0ACC0AAU6_CATRO|nr:hypothetical protein M9H77_25885 [Catharanthus roseus]